MRHILLVILALTFAVISNSCRKTLLNESQSVFVNVFPNDSSYKTNGCFQLKDGSYIIYGVDPDNPISLPLIIKVDTSGKILWKKKLSSLFHYLTIKPTSDGDILAVGAPNLFGKGVSVIKMDPGTQEIHLDKLYTVDSIKATGDYLPNFVEDTINNEFIICGFTKFDKYFLPYLLKISNNGTELLNQRFDNLVAKTNYRTTGIALNSDGYSITGTANNSLNPFKGMFYIRFNKNFEVIWDTILFDPTSFLSGTGIIDDPVNNSNIICGAVGGEGFSGTIYIREFSDMFVGVLQDTFNDYENLGRFRDIEKTKDGGYILTGKVNQLEDNDLVSYTKIYLVKLYPSLAVQWSRQFDATSPYTGVSVVQTSDGGYLIGGYEFTSSGHFTMLMIKTDETGNIIWKE